MGLGNLVHNVMSEFWTNQACCCIEARWTCIFWQNFRALFMVNLFLLNISYVW